ncbi:protein of unknown function (DUF1543) [Galbibacter orientalis DSM 19592]|uniref:DUF1543 domain-containing protein n=1 Tax=Galbibacter orientalis DSM 19592 TaxID=926559 RepID=I3C745_9FLAO|nr:DUF1543 domain-containing protein [Galbibacter orientalis]EIJ39438.1 protein of unknown function (DUF1543) [Galbibacter orientalis DSM 19592]
MATKLKLFMVMLGCKPEGRFTEQHDIFFGIGTSLKELIPEMKAFWPEAKGQIHIDAWREVTKVDGFQIDVEARTSPVKNDSQLFFINLGGYKENEFEEYHYKILTVAPTKAEAIKKSKQTTFYKHCGFKGAESHIDDKYGIDVDDIYNIEEMLPAIFKEKQQLKYTKTEHKDEDELHIGYVKIDKLLKE